MNVLDHKLENNINIDAIAPGSWRLQVILSTDTAKYGTTRILIYIYIMESFRKKV
jgi:hypothetical protein